MSTLPATQSAAPSNARVPSRASCSHCGLPVPSGLIEPDTEHQFCCSGCRSVFGIIHAGGLDDYYPMRRGLERTRRAVSIAPDRYGAFDDEAFLQRYTRENPDGTHSATLVVEGLHCAACVWLIERLSRIVPGVIDTSVAFGRSSVDVRWDPAEANLGNIARGLDSLGYPVSPPRAGALSEARRSETRRQLVRIGVAGALAGNIMLVSIALYAGVFDGMALEHLTLFRWVAAALGIVSLAWPGRVFFVGALSALRTRTTHLDLPIALALAVGGLSGIWNTITGSGEIYFDSIASLVFFLLVGRFVQSSQQRRAMESVNLLLSVMPSTVRLVGADGSIAECPAEAASVGQTAIVRPGETIPADGVVVSGESAIDRAMLTGESTPESIGPGDTVHAGVVNLGNEIGVRIEALGDATRAARIMRLVGEALNKKAPVVQLADRVAGWFVVAVSILALATALVWWRTDPSAAIDHAIALLIVTCPCALGLATPLVLSVVIGRLARVGVLVKGGEQLERLAKPGTLVLDKTGTLTTGQPSVVDWHGPTELRPLACQLEAGSTHPIGQAIARFGAAAFPDAPPPDSAEHRVGAGVRGRVSGRDVAVGSTQFMRSIHAEPNEDVTAWADQRAARGQTPVLIACDGKVAGAVTLADELRPEAKAFVGSLRTRGWRVQILSGDDDRVVGAVASLLDMNPEDAFGRVSPEDKLAHVREQRGPGTVVMVGDGVNDAAALAAADVGIAAEGGAGASLDAADVSIQAGGLDAVEHAFEGARAAMGRIQLCIGVSLGYNGLAAGLAIAGLLDPLLAAVFMPLSSITVVTLASAFSNGPPGDRLGYRGES